MMESMKAIVTSDLHMSAKKDPSDAIVSLMKLQREVFDVFYDQIIDAEADLLIMTGDNTQSGSPDDMRMLRGFLKRLRAQGIEIIMTGGNHDFDLGSEDLYERMFYGLLKPDERDPASLSYSRVLGNIRFLAMDDHAGKRSPLGILKPETVEWLKGQLRKAKQKDQKMIFLSHHNLHADSWMGRPDFYCLQPEGIKELLCEAGISLAFSGHLHDPKIYRSCLAEIVTPILLGGAHMYGELNIENNTADYQLKKLVFEDPLLAAKVKEKDSAVLSERKAVFAKLLKDSLSDHELETAVNALSEWLIANQEGALYNRREQLLENSAFERALELLGDSAYGKWIRAGIDGSCPPSDRLHIPL